MHKLTRCIPHIKELIQIAYTVLDDAKSKCLYGLNFVEHNGVKYCYRVINYYNQKGHGVLLIDDYLTLYFHAGDVCGVGYINDTELHVPLFKAAYTRGDFIAEYVKFADSYDINRQLIPFTISDDELCSDEKFNFTISTGMPDSVLEILRSISKLITDHQTISYKFLWG